MLYIRAATESFTSALPLPVQTPGLQAALDNLYARGVFSELAEIAVPASCAAFPVPPGVPTSKPRVGLLYWPAFGALRFARGTFLIDLYTLGLLRTQLGDSNRVILSYLETEDVDEVAREFVMYIAASRPLSQTTFDTPTDEPDEDDAYVLTLVDQRYYWQFCSGGGEGDAPATWTELLEQLGALVGNTPTIDTVPAQLEASPPSDKWDGEKLIGLPTNVLYECAANHVGARIVFGADESVYIQQPSDVNYAVLTQFHVDQMSVSHWAGGYLNVSEVAKALPASVTVIHFDPQTARCPTLGSTTLTLAQCAITEFSGYAGNAGVSAVLWSDIPDDASSSVKQAAGLVLARNWYRWQIAPIEATYGGFPELPVCGFVGHYEILHTASEGFTRIARPPVNYPLIFGKNPSCLDNDDGGGDGSTGTLGDCGIFSGFDEDDCFTLTVISAEGKCSCITMPQELFMSWDAGEEGWVSDTDFFTCQGHGRAILKNVSDTCCTPVLVLQGAGYGATDITLYNVGCGTEDGDSYADFVGAGTSLCASTSPPPPPPPPPPGTACCDIENLTVGVLTVPDGPVAGEYVVNFIVSGNLWHANVNNVSPQLQLDLFCDGDFGGIWGNPVGQVITDANEAGQFVPVLSMDCGPPGVLTLLGGPFGSTDDVTITF